MSRQRDSRLRAGPMDGAIWKSCAASPFTQQLDDVWPHRLHNGRWFLWLPLPQCLFLCHRPLFQGMHDCARNSGCFQNPQCLLDYLPLLLHVVGLPQHVTKWIFDG